MKLETIIEERIKEYKQSLENRFFRGDKRFSLKKEDYELKGVSFLKTPPTKALVSIHDTPYGIYLLGQNNESAITSFSINSNTATIWQIQGIRGRYRELAPVTWYEALLNSVLDFSTKLELEEIIMPTAINIRGYNEENAERLTRIYDNNAKKFQMRLTQDKKNYSLKL